jgi:NADPH2:quinone reductase
MATHRRDVATDARVTGVRTRRQIALDKFGPPQVMRWVEAAVPARGPGEVLVAVEAIGVNFADTMVRRGEYRRDQPLSFTPGFEVAGRVLEADDLAPGTAVLVWTEHGGGYADVVVAPRNRVFTLIEGITPVAAAALFTQGVTAWLAVDRYAGLQQDDRVLVPAAGGGLGSLTVQLCAHRGAEVVAAASTPEKLDLARGRGAAHTVRSDPSTITRDVRAATGGRGVDAVIDGVGGDLFAPCLKALAHNGTYVIVGSASQAPAMLDTRALMPRGQSVVGFIVARVADKDPAEPQRAFDEVQRLFLAGVLRPQLQVVGMDDVHHAHALIESRRLTGKVVIDVAEPAVSAVGGGNRRSAR